MEDVMIDIHGRSEGLAGKLSNFYPRKFTFGGVECCCLEGPVQAVKTPDVKKQLKICTLSGREAKSAGQEMNEIWQETQILHWQGQQFVRESEECKHHYMDLFGSAISQNWEFQVDLVATGTEKLVHSIGESDITKTVLTEIEFCDLLMDNRSIVIKRNPILPIEMMIEAVKMIESDGEDAFHKVVSQYGEQIAMILLIAHLRKAMESHKKWPPDRSIDSFILGKVSELRK